MTCKLGQLTILYLSLWQKKVALSRYLGEGHRPPNGSLPKIAAPPSRWEGKDHTLALAAYYRAHAISGPNGRSTELRFSTSGVHDQGPAKCTCWYATRCETRSADVWRNRGGPPERWTAGESGRTALTYEEMPSNDNK